VSDALEVRAVRAGYGGIAVLEGVSLAVPAGQVTAVLGPNGAGKTTLLRVIAGMIAPSAGEVLFRGAPIGGLPSHRIARAGVALVPEGRMIFKDMTVEDNLLMGAFSPARRAQARAGLGRVYDLFPSLAGRRHQLAGALSGGEAQMLALGRGLMAEPAVLMVDEPSLGLAPRIVTDIFRTFERLKRSGLTLLLVEQNTAKALGLSDHVHVMATGRIVLSGPASAVTAQQLHDIYFGRDGRPRGGAA